MRRRPAHPTSGQIASSALLALAALALVLPGCRTTITKERLKQIEDGATMRRELKSYHAINAAHAGHVGYVKVYEVSEPQGPAFRWKYVYDMDFEEVGFVDQRGMAYKRNPYSRLERQIHKKDSRLEVLPSDSLENNVMRMLGMDPALDSVTFRTATAADIAQK